MAGFDLIIGGIFVISILIGLMRGLIKEALSVTSWIMAIWLALTFNATVGDIVGQYINIPNATFRIWIGFCVVFVGTLFAFAIISYIITKLLVRGPIKGTDRFLGIFFGGARAGLIVVALLIVARGFGHEDNDWWKNSQYRVHFMPAVEYIEPLVFDKIPEVAQGKEKLTEAALKQLVPSSNAEPVADDSN